MTALENLHAFVLFSLATSLGWDVGRALTTVTLILLAGPAVPAALRRASRKAAFDAPVGFAPAGDCGRATLRRHRRERPWSRSAG